MNAILLVAILLTPTGFSKEGLQKVTEYADSLDTAALMVVHKGQVVLDWGNTDARYNAQSMRKSLLSALIGIAVSRGQLDINHTLADLNIDDVDGLTAEEKKARIVDLLTSRSGVYHSSLYETSSNRNRKPARGSHPPGEFFYYNNWDFNALGTIYEKATGTRIADAFEREIARPVGMKDFRAKDVVYLTQDSLTEKMAKNRSDHAAYVFMISARDLARFGQLYLQNGRWNGMANRSSLSHGCGRASTENRRARMRTTATCGGSIRMRAC
jgi:CubicO group peptidase (beta-lactamase class C family)